jgi:hypothetical protein
MRRTSAVGSAGLLLAAALLPTEAQQPSTVEKLLTQGWEIAGYVAVAGNRSLVLFKHREHRYLVQCSVLIDVTRNPSVVTNCYELR